MTLPSKRRTFSIKDIEDSNYTLNSKDSLKRACSLTSIIRKARRQKHATKAQSNRRHQRSLKVIMERRYKLGNRKPICGCLFLDNGVTKAIREPPSQRQSIRGKFTKVGGRSAIHLEVSLRVEIGIGDICLVDDWFVGHVFVGLGFAKGRVHRFGRGVLDVSKKALIIYFRALGYYF